jgi:hypothetical protein
MSPRSPLAGFLVRFVIGYALLIVPWPGFGSLYSGYFRTLGQTVLGRDSGRLVRFEAVPAQLHHLLDTRVLLAKLKPGESGATFQVSYLELDARGIGWVPTALMVALVVATPVSWRRRGWALLWGLLAVHIFILCGLAAAVWNTSADLQLVNFPPFWKQVLAGLDETLITQLGASFVVPVVIWMLVTLRSQDLVAWQGGAKNKQP